MNTVDVLKALADETRLRMVNLLFEAGDLCSCEVETVLGINQSNASRHLSRLKAAGVLIAEKRGLWVHFRPSAASNVGTLVRSALELARADVPALDHDLERLKDYRSSGHTCATIAQWAASTVYAPERYRSPKQVMVQQGV